MFQLYAEMWCYYFADVLVIKDLIKHASGKKKG